MWHIQNSHVQRVYGLSYLSELGNIMLLMNSQAFPKTQAIKTQGFYFLVKAFHRVDCRL